MIRSRQRDNSRVRTGRCATRLRLHPLWAQLSVSLACATLSGVRVTIPEIKKIKAGGIPIPMLTSYDAATARLLDEA